MRHAWTILTMMFAIAALLACQPVGSPVQDPQDTAQTTAAGSLPQGSETDLSPTLSPEDTQMALATPPDEATVKMVTLVTQHLAQKLGIAADQVVLSAIKPVVWRDASLGCPKPGIDYIQVETPGFNIFLEAGGKPYNYHTDASKRFVLCNK